MTHNVQYIMSLTTSTNVEVLCYIVYDLKLFGIQQIINTIFSTIKIRVCNYCVSVFPFPYLSWSYLSRTHRMTSSVDRYRCPSDKRRGVRRQERYGWRHFIRLSRSTKRMRVLWVFQELKVTLFYIKWMM